MATERRREQVREASRRYRARQRGETGPDVALRQTSRGTPRRGKLPMRRPKPAAAKTTAVARRDAPEAELGTRAPEALRRRVESELLFGSEAAARSMAAAELPDAAAADLIADIKAAPAHEDVERASAMRSRLMVVAERLSVTAATHLGGEAPTAEGFAALDRMIAAMKVLGMDAPRRSVAARAPEAANPFAGFGE